MQAALRCAAQVLLPEAAARRPVLAGLPHRGGRRGYGRGRCAALRTRRLAEGCSSARMRTPQRRSCGGTAPVPVAASEVASDAEHDAAARDQLADSFMHQVLGPVASRKRRTSLRVVRQRQPSAYSVALSTDSQTGPLLSKAGAHSIEVQKYGIRQETEIGADGRPVHERQLPPTDERSAHRDPFRDARIRLARGLPAHVPGPYRGPPSGEEILEEEERRRGERFPEVAADGSIVESAEPPPAPDALAVAPAKQLAITYVNPYHVPDVLRGTDQCPGCGALLQCRERFQPGYVSLESIRLHIEHHDRMMKLRETFFTRQARHHEFVQRFGWQEGLEYMDYITDREMDAVHKYHPRPIVCERCTALTAYCGHQHKMVLPAEDWRGELDEIRSKPGCLVVHVVSLWDWEGTFVKNLRDYVHNRRVLVLCTFADAIPMPWKTEFKFRDAATDAERAAWCTKLAARAQVWARSRTRGLGPVDCIAIGNWDRTNISLAARAIEHWRRGGDVYLVGCTNVGKSHLMNNLYEEFCRAPAPHPEAQEVLDVTHRNGQVSYSHRWEIPDHASPTEKALSLTLDNPFAKQVRTVSEVPGTTLRKMGFPIGHEADGTRAFIYDTPGIVQKGHIVNVLPFPIVSAITPKKRISPQYFKMFPGTSVLFGALCRVDLIKGPSDGILLHVFCRKNRVHFRALPTAEADVFRERFRGVRSVLGPPCTRELAEELGDLVNERDFFIEMSDFNRLNATVEIAVSGFLWMCATLANGAVPQDVVLRVATVKGLKVSKRPALLGDTLRHQRPSRRTMGRARLMRRRADPWLLHCVARRKGVPLPPRLAGRRVLRRLRTPLDAPADGQPAEEDGAPDRNVIDVT
eukprot:TRINITY_DN56257_c0_g1_i1.p1 TRINITY_DN56257_c0_g1~~TRINITY_DN56257_c0_g1_i1.p1  ORF type:complete len:863 (+),score=185.13 TRINITY_DN56257_c0_g1_i1:73-2661(+)